MSASACAANPTELYKIAPTRTCLIGHHAPLIAGKYTTPLHRIQWILGYGAGFPVTIEMAFFRNSTQAAAYERTLRHTYRVDRLSRTWIRHHLLRRLNVVVHPDVTAAKVTPSQFTTVVDCLQR